MRRSVVFSVSALVITLVAPSALADGKNACLASYVRGQELRQQGKLTAARDALVSCAQAACPSALRADCATWLDEVDRSLPTIVVAAKDDRGADRADARLIIDGVQVAGALDGRARALDPGTHHVAIVLADGRREEQTIVAKQGERDRIVELHVRAESAAASLGPSAPTPAPETRAVPVAALVLGGVAIASFAVTAGFWTAGWYGSPGKQSLDECAPRCAPDDVSRVKTKLLAGNIAFGVGVVAAAAGIVLWATSSSAFAVEASPRGASVGMRGRF